MLRPKSGAVWAKALPLCLVAIAIVAMACGGDDATPEPTATSDTAAEATNTPEPTSTPEPTATTTPGPTAATSPEPTATASATSTSGPRTVVDATGNEVEVPANPERVVVLEFSFVDALASVGMAPVGIADDNNRSRIIPQVAEIIGDDWTSVGTRAQPSLEVILSLEPDLIIADFERHTAIADQLSDIAPTIILKSLEASYQENLDSMVVIGEALGKEDLVEARLDEHDTIMASLAEQAPDDEERKILSAVVWDAGFNAHASNAYTSGVLSAIGLQPAIVQEDPYAELNLEGIAAVNPDIMFLMVAGEHTLVDDWQGNPLWENLNAVKNDTVIEMDRNLWSRFRGIIAAEEIARDAIEALYG